MSKTEYKPDYQRNLPHYQPKGSTLFLTTRIVGSLSKGMLWQLRNNTEEWHRKLAAIANEQERMEYRRKEMKRDFVRLDAFLDSNHDGIDWLVVPEVAKMICESLHHRDGDVFTLYAYVIMPNHIHVVFRPLEDGQGEFFSLSSIMMSFKRWTAGQANMILGRDGQFWQHESYDHVIRDEEELQRIIAYVLNNPTKAGLAQELSDWPWAYQRQEW